MYRMYPNIQPQVNDVVMTKVLDYNNSRVRVSLLEYNINGMIMIRDLSKKRVRSVRKEVKVNDEFPACVVLIQNGEIDLSKRNLTDNEIEVCQDRYRKSKLVKSIFNQVSHIEKVELRYLYENVGYPLHERYGHTLDGFKRIVFNKETFDDLEIKDNVRKELIRCIARRFSLREIKMQSLIDLTCFKFEGVKAIKAALLKGDSLNTKDIPVKINLSSSPTYLITVVSSSITDAIKKITEVTEIIKKEIEERGGDFSVRQSPEIVSQRGEF